MWHSRDIICRPLMLLLFVVGMLSCASEDCPINNTVMGKMVFCDTFGDAVYVDGTLTVSAVRPQGDTIILNRKNDASSVSFPLCYTHQVDTFIFNYNNGAAYDSLYIIHTNTPTLVSVDCGMAMFHSLVEVSSTHNAIDTLIIKSSQVDYDERENIQVIYR